jgi:hypothetical protein
MNSDPGWLFGKMCPDFEVPVPARAAAATADGAAPWPDWTTPPATFADVLTCVDGFYRTIAAPTSLRSFPRLGNSGIVAPGRYWTLSISVWHSADNASSVCSLATVLAPTVAPKYYLSPTACAGILRRAAKRGKTLPEALRHALEAVARQATRELVTPS